MKINKGMIVLAVAVVYFAFTGIRLVNSTKANNETILKEVTVVADGRINPANDGKLVLVAGKISFDGNIPFEELDPPIHSFKAERTVQDFISYQKNGETHYDWQERKEADPNASTILDFVFSTEKTIPTRIGDFVLDNYGLSKVNVNATYTAAESIAGLKWCGTRYKNPAHEDSEQVGDVSLLYRYFDVDKYDSLSVLAQQSGNTFTPYKLNKKNEVYLVFNGRIDSADKLKEELATQVTKTGHNRIWFIVILVIIGVLLIRNDLKSNATKAGQTAAKTPTKGEKKASAKQTEEQASDIDGTAKAASAAENNSTVDEAAGEESGGAD